MLKNFITALQFLTIFTVRKEHRIEEQDLAKSMVYFPLVGFLIGFLLVNADKLFSLVALPQTIASFLIVVLSILVTRALHIDGLADTFDGLMGGRDHASRLAIMRDSRLGTAGVLGIFSVLFMKYLCINNLFDIDRVGALLISPILARWSQTFMVYQAHYGREEGMAKSFVGHLRASGLITAAAIAAGLTAFVVLRLDARSVMLFFSLLCTITAMTYGARAYFTRKLGGVTGDAIGAVSELNEVLVLFLFVLFSNGS